MNPAHGAGFSVDGGVLRDYADASSMTETIYTDYRSPDIRGALHAVPKGFARAKEDVVNVWVKPIRLLENLTPQARDRNRSTQLTKNDPSVDLLSEAYDGWGLVRLADGTVGWVEMKRLERVDHPTRPHEVLLTSKEFEERYLGVPYLHGGTTREGIDCSGLTSRYFSHVRGMTIPRHSTDQWKAGRSMRDDEREPGDLLNLRHREKTTDHVGLLLADGKVFHACLFHSGVVIESLQEVLKRYDLLGTTRLS